MINPRNVVLSCKSHHRQVYLLPDSDFVACRHPGCNHRINSSHITRGTHPYVYWACEEQTGVVSVIPLTSQNTFVGIPSTSVIKSNERNGLSKDSLALIFQLTTINISCLKDTNGGWLKRMGGLTKKEKEAIQERLLYWIRPEDAGSDWFLSSASATDLERASLRLTPDERERLVNVLIDSLE